MKRKYPDRTKRERQNNWIKRKRKEIALEISVENRLCGYLDEAGIEHEKYGQNGDPDRLIFLGDSRHIWFEFKREKFGCLTPAQKRRFDQMVTRGERIFIVTNADEGWRIVCFQKQSFAVNAEPQSFKERLHSDSKTKARG